MRKIFVLGFGVLLLAAACNNTSQTTVTTNPPSSQVLSGSTEVNITSSGFSPSSITVKAGTQVVFKNMDSSPHWPASNPHPTHTDLPGFDALKGLANGGTYSFTFDKLGTWGFHDHMNPSSHGSVTVVQ